MTELSPLHIIFYVFATLAVCSAIAVVATRNPVRSVLSLVLTFFSMAPIWMILHAEFLSLILILVYVGAVMTLFLFVVMMLNIDKEYKTSGFVRFLPFALVIILVILGLDIAVVGPKYFGANLIRPPIEAGNYNNIQQLGSILYTDFAYPFEIAGVILLTAIIAAITLANRGPIKRRVQSVSDQVNIRPEDRVRLVNLKPDVSLPKKEGTN